MTHVACLFSGASERQSSQAVTSSSTTSHSGTSNSHQQPAEHVVQNQLRPRLWLKILFAVLLALIAGKLSAEDSQLRYEWYNPDAAPSPKHPQSAVDPSRVAGGVTRSDVGRSRRPAWVELTAQPANFDADAEPDGWRVRLVIRDRSGDPVTPRARASFELMPRISTINRGHFANAQKRPVRWSKQLPFDDDGNAYVDDVNGWDFACFDHPPPGN